MYVVLLLAAGAILGGVVVVAMGRGGEMTLFRRDIPLAPRRPRTPTEVATQRLPLGPVGYQVQATEEALIVAANLLAERDQEIAALRSEIWRLGRDDHAAAHDQQVDSDDQARDAAGGSRGSPPGANTAGGSRGSPPRANTTDATPPAGLAGTEQPWRQ